MGNLNINQIYLIVIAVHLFYFIYYSFIPMDKLFTFYNLAARFRDKYEEYDWNETVRRERVYNFISLVYLTLFFYLSKIFGREVAIFGLLSFCILVILFGIWIGPVKKRSR